jgi:hypothetical protein
METYPISHNSKQKGKDKIHIILKNINYLPVMFKKIPLSQKKKDKVYPILLPQSKNGPPLHIPVH